MSLASAEIIPAPMVYSPPAVTSITKDERHTIDIYPDSGNRVFSPASNRIIRINVPSQDYLDCNSSYVLLTVEGTSSAGIPAFERNIEALFRRMTVYTAANTVTIEDNNLYNMLAVTLVKSIGSEYTGAVGPYTGYTQQATYPASNYAKRRYVVEFLGSGFLNNMKYLPLKHMGGQNSNAFIIELELADPDSVAYPTTGVSLTGLSYTVSDVVYKADLVKVDPDYDRAIQTQLDSGNEVIIAYDRFSHHPFQHPVNQFNFTTALSQFETSLMAVYVTYRNANDIVNPNAKSLSVTVQPGQTNAAGGSDPEGTTFGEDLTGEPKKGGILEYRFKAGNRYFPEQPVQIGGPKLEAEAFYEYLKALQKQRDYRSGTQTNVVDSEGDTDYSYKDFIIGQSFRPHDFSKDFVSGLNTSAPPVRMDLIMKLDSGNSVFPPNGFVGDAYFLYNSSMVLTRSQVRIVS